MLSPRLAALHRDAFVHEQMPETTVQLDAYRGESDLDDLDLGSPGPRRIAARHASGAPPSS